MNRSSTSSERALVLAGGGAAGHAWEVGLIAGLLAAEVDITDADLIVGTSAGSTVAAQIACGSRPDELYAAVLAETPPTRAGTVAGTGAAGGGRAASPIGPSYLAWSDAIIAAAADPSDMRRRMGAAALELDASGGATTPRWRDIVAGRLPDHQWPDRALLIPAVDAGTGEPVVFQRDSGIDLVDAVAASTSAMVPYRIGDHAYLNGGYRRSENADLAAGCGRVLVLSPFGGRSRMPPEWGMDLASQVAELRAGGRRVECLFPDAATRALFDANALDPSTRMPAARGGYAQGRALAEQVAAFWRCDGSGS